MFKKFILPIALTASLVLGNFTLQSANAAKEFNIEQEKQIQVQIESLLKELSIEDFEEYVQLFQQLEKQFAQADWNKVKHRQVHKQMSKQVWHKEQAEQEKPSFEEPKQEQAGQEQAKEEESEARPLPERPARPEEPRKEQQTERIPELSEFEQEVVELTNIERAKAGLAPLQADAELSRVAREKSSDMARLGYFDHNSPSYGSPFDMMRAYGISYRTAGENIAKGQSTPAEVVRAWMNSEGHRANIMNPNFTHIGVGFLEAGNHWTQMFIGK